MLTPERDERLNRLCEALEMNRNRLISEIAEKATPNQLREIIGRK